MQNSHPLCIATDIVDETLGSALSLHVLYAPKARYNYNRAKGIPEVIRSLRLVFAFTEGDRTTLDPCRNNRVSCKKHNLNRFRQFSLSNPSINN